MRNRVAMGQIWVRRGDHAAFCIYRHDERVLLRRERSGEERELLQQTFDELAGQWIEPDSPAPDATVA